MALTRPEAIQLLETGISTRFDKSRRLVQPGAGTAFVGAGDPLSERQLLDPMVREPGVGHGPAEEQHGESRRAVCFREPGECAFSADAD